MARPREFEEVEVLDRVVDLFRAKGYAATSMEDIESATGLGRSSLYAAFQGKHQLFLSALNRYDSDRVEKMMRALAAEPTGRKAVERLFDIVIEQSMRDPSGCLIANSAMEVGLSDPDAAKRIQSNRERIEGAIRAAVERGRADGSVKRGVEPAAAARHLFAVVLGMRVLAKSGASRRELRSVAETALGGL